jgi:hypothetical protein
VRKISPPPGFDPLTVQPVGSHYTEYARTIRSFRIKTRKKETCGMMQNKMARPDTGGRQTGLKELAINLKGNILVK